MPVTDILSDRDAAHLLRRVGFGPTTTEIAALTGLTRQQAVAQVMNFSGAPTVVRPAVDDPQRRNQWDCFVAGIEWWVERMRITPVPLQEKMTLFWHNHFCSSQDKLNDMTAMFDQNQKLRVNGMGDFESLCQIIAVDPAMLVYLDNATNKVGSEQENFARELMELFTLGVGNFSEADVVAMAKAWTGHNIVGWNGSFTDPTYVFNANRHDNTVKALFDVAPRNWDGPATITEIVKGSKRAACARFISAKLFRYFAHTNPSAAVVDAITAQFSPTMVIADAVRAVLLHDEFWAPVSRHALVKSPIEFVVDLLRRLNRPAVDAGLPWAIEGMGQVLFYPPNVAGWGQNAYWLSTATAWGRGGFLNWFKWHLDDWGIWATLKDLDADAGVARLISDLGILDVSAGTRQAMRDWFSAAKASASWSIQPNALVVGAMCPEFHVI